MGVKRSDMNENNRFALSLGVDVNMVLTIAVIAVSCFSQSFVVVYSIFLYFGLSAESVSSVS